MNMRYAVGVSQFERMNTKELRETFVVEPLFQGDEIQQTYWETDRTVVGSAVPLASPLKLETCVELASEYFCERRELGVLNIGGTGTISVDGTAYPSNELDCMYIGRGSRDVTFASYDPAAPAKFYLISYPAHTTFPTVRIRQAEANAIHLGSDETANQRTIFQYIHEGGAKSCQLVLGFTQLDSGSVWNTMPPHTHSRRSEVYMYFNVREDATVFHFMGPGDQTRNLLLHGEQAVLSPIWSVHSGCGTRAYSFIWAMGGENQRFDDMDGIPIQNLR